MSNAAATRASGIAIAASPATETSRAVAEARAILGPGPFQHIIAFFSAKHDATQLCDRLREAFPGVPVSGCSTAGEITPAGMVEGGILLLAFPREGSASTPTSSRTSTTSAWSVAAESSGA